MDVRRELRHINDEYRRFGEKIGETILWYEFDREASDIHPVYDVGLQRIFKRPKLVPVLWVTQAEGNDANTPQGDKPTGSLQFAMSYEAARDSGLRSPSESTAHLYDLVYYDGRFFDVRTYQVRGRTQADVIIGVAGTEVFLSEEYVFDRPPAV